VQDPRHGSADLLAKHTCRRHNTVFGETDPIFVDILTRCERLFICDFSDKS